MGDEEEGEEGHDREGCVGWEGRGREAEKGTGRDDTDREEREP